MGMKDPVPTFSYLVERLAEDFPELAYLHVIEPGVSNYWNVPIGPGHVILRRDFELGRSTK